MGGTGAARLRSRRPLPAPGHRLRRGRPEHQHGLRHDLAGRRPLPAAPERAVDRRLLAQPPAPARRRQRLPHRRPPGLRPVPGKLAGDAWLGVFKSFDGGHSWQSYLLPGYPQDNSPEGLASPLKGYSAAADPTVRGGQWASSTTAASRSTAARTTARSSSSTYFDANAKENGSVPDGSDTIPYQGTVVVDTGTSGQFLDKTVDRGGQTRAERRPALSTCWGNRRRCPPATSTWCGAASRGARARRSCSRARSTAGGTGRTRSSSPSRARSIRAPISRSTR